MVGGEPLGCPSMYQSQKSGAHTKLTKINPFIDGAAVGNPGNLCYDILKKSIEIDLISEEKSCEYVLGLKKHEDIVAEAAGALGVACLEQHANEIRNKSVVCVISGGNIDPARLRYMELYESQNFQKTQKFIIRGK